jgi:hypothetical protein
MLRVPGAFLIAVLGTVVSFSSPATSQASGAGVRTFKVDATLHDGGRLVGAPSVILRENAPAIVSLSSDGGYSMRLVAREEPYSAQFGRRVSVTSEIHLRTMDRWAAVASPTLILPIGKSAVYESRGSGRAAQETDRSFKLSLTVSDMAEPAH